MRVLVHICCGPCAIEPLSGLQDEGHELMGLFVNPNIHPLTEYLRRRDGAVDVCEKLGVKLVVRDADYDPVTFLRNAAWREDNRCPACYGMRLGRAAQIARNGGFDAFTTTLLYSRKQKHDLIRQVGESLGLGEGPAFLYRDFRTGWERGIERAKAWGIYRQQYCGCIYSELERYRKELNR
ncbi:MAG: epoxyqueuosine reductase QueH [Desulfovibrionaceae bacterium]